MRSGWSAASGPPQSSPKFAACSTWRSALFRTGGVKAAKTSIERAMMLETLSFPFPGGSRCQFCRSLIPRTSPAQGARYAATRADLQNRYRKRGSRST